MILLYYCFTKNMMELDKDICTTIGDIEIKEVSRKLVIF